MTPAAIRRLADCLELGFMTDDDRKRWASDLKGLAKDIERSVLQPVKAKRPKVKRSMVCHPWPPDWEPS